MPTGIYHIKNIQNEKVYIGSAVDYSNRKSRHIRLLNHGTHHSKKLQRAWNKYGSESFVFELINACKREYLIFMEQIFIDGHDAVRGGYNVAPRAGSTLGVMHSAETRALQSAVKMGKSNHTPESIALLSQSCREAWTDEKKEKQRKVRTGRKHSQETKDKIAASKVGKPRSDELKAKLSAFRTGRKLSDAHKSAIAEAGRLRYAKLRGEI